MSAFYSARINEFVESNDNFKNLIPILESIPIDTLKETIYQNVDAIHTAKLKKLYFRSLPIDEIIPVAVIQYILSFNVTESHSTKVVSKL